MSEKQKTEDRGQDLDVKKTTRQQTIRADIGHSTSDIWQFLTSDI